MTERLPIDARRFGDREIAKILKRATQLQRESPARPDPAGLTLAELEEIALEAGIDPENLRLAASELAGRPDDDSLQVRLLGAPLTQRIERIVPGELPEEAFGSLVPLLQAEAGTPGQATMVGSTLSWASTSTGNHARTLTVLVISEDGQTRLQAEERSSQLALGFHMGITSGGLGFGIPGGLAVGAAAGAIPGIAVGVAATGAAYAVARTLYRVTTNRRHRKVETMLDRLAERVRQLVARRAVEAGDGGSAPLPGAATPSLPPG